MSNRNATATWSGFAHQGQVGLLVALRKMQEIDQAEYSQYYLEYENKEDVAIYKHAETLKYLSVHQVKAYYSGGGVKSKYKKALADFECCGEDYLHTVMEVEDWDTSKTENPKDVKRYLYSGSKFHCGTDEIGGFLIEELKQLSDGNVATAKLLLQRLTYELDQKICAEHRNKNKANYDVKFSFAEIKASLENGKLQQDESLIYDYRKAFYEIFVERIKITNATDSHIERISEKIIEKIYNLEDAFFIRFLKFSDLCENPDRLKQVAFWFQKDGFRDVFFNVLLGVEKVPPLLKDEVVQYNVPNSSDTLVLTSMIREEEDANLDYMVANIIENISQLNVLWESHQLINRHHTAKFVEHHNTLKNLVIKDELEEAHITYFSKKGGLIKREQAKEILNNV
ncbi:ABC-three component system protein [Pareuzebyella sediminis]|uniref:ABC-three component system protein n=1 Tax=Pareuzebyella sediminis TaxID=2607998 RepID=UPI0011EE1CB7|nr:ABC-three component system protein [Pareuzebyella sediminis]